MTWLGEFFQGNSNLRDAEMDFRHAMPVAAGWASKPGSRGCILPVGGSYFMKIIVFYGLGALEYGPLEDGLEPKIAKPTGCAAA
jgi:hypothetical protein